MYDAEQFEYISSATRNLLLDDLISTLVMSSSRITVPTNSNNTTFSRHVLIDNKYDVNFYFPTSRSTDLCYSVIYDENTLVFDQYAVDIGLMVSPSTLEYASMKLLYRLAINEQVISLKLTPQPYINANNSDIVTNDMIFITTDSGIDVFGHSYRNMGNNGSGTTSQSAITNTILYDSAEGIRKYKLLSRLQYDLSEESNINIIENKILCEGSEYVDTISTMRDTSYTYDTHTKICEIDDTDFCILDPYTLMEI